MGEMLTYIFSSLRSSEKRLDVCLYALIDRVMKCIEHCATARAYGRFREAGVMTKMDDVAAGIVKSKEEKDNVEKRFN